MFFTREVKSPLMDKSKALTWKVKSPLLDKSKVTQWVSAKSHLFVTAGDLKNSKLEILYLKFSKQTHPFLIIKIIMKIIYIALTLPSWLL